MTGNEILKILYQVLLALPGILLTIFSLYFALQKIGIKVKLNYTWGGDLMVADGITNIVATNQKNKSLSIYSISAFWSDKRFLQLAEFKDPVVLKPFESTNIKIDPVSEYVLDGKPYQLDPFTFETADFYIETLEKWVRCHAVGRNTPDFVLKGTRTISSNKNSLNGIVYRKDVIYAASIENGEKKELVFINDVGWILNGSFEFNAIPEHCLKDEDQVKSVLEENGIKVRGVFKLNHLGV